MRNRRPEIRKRDVCGSEIVKSTKIISSACSSKPEVYEKFSNLHKRGINAVYFHPLLQKFASAGSDGSILLSTYSLMKDGKKPKAPKPTTRFIGHNGSVNDVCFSSDGNIMLSGSDDRTVRIWTPTFKGYSRFWHAHGGPVRSIAFNPIDNSQIASGSNDKIIKIWSLDRIGKPGTKTTKFTFALQKFLASLTEHSNWIRSVRYSTEGHLIISASDDKTVNLFDLRNSNRKPITAASLQDAPLHADFLLSGMQYFGACTDKGHFHIFDIRRDSKILQSYLNIHQGPITSFDFHTSGDYAVCVGGDGKVKILDLVEGHSYYTLHGHTGPLNAVKVSYDGQLIATAGRCKEVVLWNGNLKSYQNDEFTYCCD